ncbi:hypothetical protein H0H81_010072 [Sphagnurus paluster]|uniref:Endonuclease/exonuclease/phosphatase domain-containing protein n=1 Tax=Sphagnurus paluster TaxID=117069 RepID=A0A9P7FV14_9AGAR|nr:hypothetical protein H0H81_010072 [Sphagnurus paluster]
MHNPNVPRATPFQPSQFPGAGCRRVCTVARFKTTATNKIFTVLNSHLDHHSEEARKLGASLLLARARFEARETGAPVFVTGDLNSRPEGIDAGAYKILTGAENPLPIAQDFLKKYAVNELGNFRMLDLRTEAPPENSSKALATFSDFAVPDLKAPINAQTLHIDFIFGGSSGGWTAERYRIVTTPPNDGILASDHYPVSADISMLS